MFFVISNAEKYKELGYTASIALHSSRLNHLRPGKKRRKTKQQQKLLLLSVILKPDSELETVPVRIFGVF